MSPPLPLAAALVALCVCFAIPALAVEDTRVDDPDARLRVRIDQVLDGVDVGGVTMRQSLADLEFEDCLKEIAPELTFGLDALRVVHVSAIERRNYRKAWRLWEGSVDGLSDDAWQLLSTWLDSPETARRLYLCEDDLPRSWQSADSAGFVREALDWFDAAAAERGHRLRKGAPADREQAVMELAELESALLRRYIATYPEGDAHDDLLVELEARLDLMWEVLVEPFHLGFTPRARTTEATAVAQNMGRARIQSPFSGIAIPDPRDVAARDRVVRSWRRQRNNMSKEIDTIQDELDDLVLNIDERVSRGEIDEELDKLVREAGRVDARLAATVASLERMQQKVRYHSTGRSWIDGMLSNGYRRRAVKRLSKREAVVQEERRSVEATIEAAVASGAMEPGQLRDGGESLTGRRIGGRDDVGPGNWLVGLPESTTTAAVEAADAEGIPPGTGWVSRTYEGPMPTPSGVWSDELVESIRSKHPQLDDADARILLGLVQLAYRELRTRSQVEDAVARSLATPTGLALLGEESTLSDLWLRGRSTAEQPIVTFVLKLFF
ncbi:MAG: hypothetical protein KDA24_24810 [Deltaproteobacteria bacterium]|nr:hypothetical protein [Deltaproteobacteria bacterium]